MHNPEKDSFQKGIAQMRELWGANNIGSAKIDLYWGELKDFNSRQITSIINTLMGELQFAPTVVQVREKCSQLREKIRQFEREQERRDARDFWEGTYHSNDVKMIVETIKNRMEGKCDDKTWIEFQEFIKSHGEKSNPVRCKKCQDTGVYYDVQTRPFKCHHTAAPIRRPITTFAEKSATES